MEILAQQSSRAQRGVREFKKLHVSTRNLCFAHAKNDIQSILCFQTFSSNLDKV